MSDVPHTDTPSAAEELGRLLRHTREQNLLSIGDVSEHLKLPARQVEALENADFGKLPEPVFVRGFLRSYGRYLNLDETVLNNYLEQIAFQTQGIAPAPKKSAAESLAPMTYHQAPIQKPFPKWIIGMTALALIVGGVYLWQSKSHSDTQRQEAQSEEAAPAVLPPNLEGGNVQVLPMQQASDAAASAPAQADPAGQASAPAASGATDAAAGLTTAPGELAIKLRFRSFLTVTDKDGNMLISKIVPANSEHRYSGSGPYHVRIGFARGSSVSYSGRDINVADHMRDNKTAAFNTDAPAAHP
ncbi:MAG: DUF4115 domain-containing protein [Eikenella sp.]|nr:DUF4115 domain-containing protein [Eikenella sp.]